MEKLTKIRDLFILFIIFAVCGWIYEVVLTVCAYGYFENRGFLRGPWLPIYGFGGIALYLLLGRFGQSGSVGRRLATAAALIVPIGLSAAAMELAASYLLDAVGVGFRTLWFYDGEPFNFDGRISLISSLRFGILGAAAICFGVPLWRRLVGCRQQNAVSITGLILAVLFVVDLAVRLTAG